MTIKIIHCVPSLHPDYGGPARTVVALTDSLARLDAFSIHLLTQSSMDVSIIGSAEPRVCRHVAVNENKLSSSLALLFRQKLKKLISSYPKKIGLIHSHGIWHPVNHWAATSAVAAAIPLIIQPRGMLEPWALKQKQLKKRFALAMFQRRDLEFSRAFIATSDKEYESLRSIGLRQAVAVIPNGVILPVVDSALVKTQSNEGVLKSERILLFLSRIHPKKGVLELVKAWSQIATKGWRLRIAGPDEGGHWTAVAQLIAQLGLEDSVEYYGPVEGEQKAVLYREADLFVLPTFSENFGLVVAEALAFGVPVITTRGAPWADLEAYGCGWWIDVGVAPLIQALRAATTLSDKDRQTMGARGRIYVQRYDWDLIAEQTLALYRWVLHQGERPSFVRVE